jgi:hypothetical protein
MARRDLTLTVWVLLLAGCGGEPPVDEELDEADDEASVACTFNETQACECDELPGRQVCNSAGWGDCECLSDDGIVTQPVPGTVSSGSVPAGNLRSDIEFEYERTKAQAGSCEPGDYTGDFMGLYASQLTFINFPIPVFALGQLDRPGLAFTLEKKGNGELLEIANGKMEGTADGFFPFRGTLTGSLDCQTGEFKSELSGFYSLGVEGVGMFKFKGPLTGKYDKVKHAIEMGTWRVDEYDPPPTLPNAGGQGNWHANWKAP